MKPQFSDTALQYMDKSIRENLEDLLLETVRRYLAMRETPVIRPHSHDSETAWLAYVEAEKLLAMQRGQVKAAARAVLIWRNSYYKDRVREIKEIEQEFLRRVKNERK
jgi:hypothetical protein